MSLTTIKRTALVALVTLALLATASSTALAAGAEYDVDVDDVEVNTDSGARYWLQGAPLEPWNQTIVLVHIEAGSDELVDTSDVMPDFEAYVSGEKPYVVNYTISIDEYCFGNGDAVTGQGLGACQDTEPRSRGEMISQALNMAGNACDYRHWIPCHIILVNYDAPTGFDGLAAVAKAWELNRRGHVVHTIGVGQENPDQDWVDFNGYLATAGTSRFVESAENFQATFEWLLVDISLSELPYYDDWDYPEEPACEDEFGVDVDECAEPYSDEASDDDSYGMP